jgi:hypothetical protein
MIYASFGEISHGTLRPEDLIPTFATELEYHIQRNAAEWCSDEGRAIRDGLLKLAHDAQAIEFDGDEQPDPETIGDMICSLEDELDTFAPRYAYFSANEGDGSCFGFWLSPQFTEEDDFDGLRVSDLSDIPDNYEGEALVVNDHGNMTLYDCVDGKQTEVWGIV